MSCSKKQKQFENDQEMDYISSLPDTLLCYILSFVETKFAVATSILSRRWVSIWTKVPVLSLPKFYVSIHEFDSQKKRYHHFVKKVLLRNDTPCFQRVELEFLQGSDSFWLYALNNFILRREIQEINLTKEWAGPCNVPMHLPTALYSRERLVVLRLRGPFNISLPLSLHLPRLETLVLHGLYFEGQDTLKIATSGCPALKELVIEYCEGFSKLYVNSLPLNRLKIKQTSETIVAVKGSNVRILDFDNIGRKYLLDDLSSLVEARICIYANEATKLPWALELIKGISHVRTLRLAQSTVELFGLVSENELPKFPNLTLLDIEISHSMFHMLKYAPKIMHLIVNVGRTIDDDETRPFPSNFLPQCLLSLPIIEIRNFGGFENDSALVKYFFKNATVLKEMKIHMHRASMKRERDACKKLLSFPRFSPCDVIICSSCGDNAL